MRDLQAKRKEILEVISPICEAFKIDDFDYIISETGKQDEALRIYDTYIGCSCNSVEAVIDELIGWLFVKRFCKHRCIGAFRVQTLNRVKAHWLNINNYPELLKGGENGEKANH